MTPARRRPDRPHYWRLYRQAFLWVWSAARTELSISLVVQLVGAGALATGLLFGREIVQAVTRGSPAPPLQTFLPEILGLALSLIVAGVSSVVTRETEVLVGELAAQRLQGEIVEIAGSVDYEQFERQDFHDLLARADEHGTDSSLQIVYDLMRGVQALATSLAMVSVVATSAPQLIPALAVIALPFLLVARLSAGLAFRTLCELTPQDRLRHYLYRALTGKSEAKEVRVFHLHAALRTRWARQYDQRLAQMRRMVAKRTMLNGIATVAGAGMVASVLVVVVRSAVAGQIALGDAAVAIVALQQLTNRLRTATDAASSLREAALFLDDFARFRELRKVECDISAQEPLPPLKLLRAEELSFQYPGTSRTVLDNVTIEVRSGEVVALVGVSGSGKTTLAHVIAGLYEPTSGQISWNGVDTATMPKVSYWRSLTAVFQDFARYELTAHENISISDHDRQADRSAVHKAALQAGISEAIERLPAGFESILSRTYDNGAELSVGQWQRVAVARAFFRDASLLVLDEPAAALDPLAEQQLYERVEELCAASRSALLVSHRFSTVRLADRIYVMHEGRIAEHGSHDQLMEMNGHYAGLFRAQAAGYMQSRGQSAGSPLSQ